MRMVLAISVLRVRNIYLMVSAISVLNRILNVMSVPCLEMSAIKKNHTFITRPVISVLKMRHISIIRLVIFVLKAPHISTMTNATNVSIGSSSTIKFVTLAPKGSYFIMMSAIIASRGSTTTMINATNAPRIRLFIERVDVMQKYDDVNLFATNNDCSDRFGSIEYLELL